MFMQKSCSTTFAQIPPDTTSSAYVECRCAAYTTEWDKMLVTILHSKREATGVGGQFFFQHGLNECCNSESIEAEGYFT